MGRHLTAQIAFALGLLLTGASHAASTELSERSTCSTIRVQSGDSCGSLTARCGISDAKFYQYNPKSNLCSTLAVGEYICCSPGTLPNLKPVPYSNGTCHTYSVASGDTCSAIAATYTITINNINTWNQNTWGWLGCKNLQAGQNICLSKGTPPFPAPMANAKCGPQVPGTSEPTNDTDWASLNPCPLNACCDKWGQCGTTPEFCTKSNSSTGAPGTAAPGQNGCISNCGVEITNNNDPPSSFASVTYYEAFNNQRPCLNMKVSSIPVSKYSHIHFAYANITSAFTISVAGAPNEFDEFAGISGSKRIVSFGGWAFSTDPSTYMIFREGVKKANRQKLAQNVVDFIAAHDLDGVDFDWEYPGEPDIAGIPAGSPEDGRNYLAFVKEVRSLLPSEKSISIAAPASYWYLRGFPIAEMAKVLDYIVYMTYDLHGIWDLGNKYSQVGCPGGNCLRSDINLTDTTWALAMITKAGVPANKIMVGTTSYGRTFEMTTPGCWTQDCTYTQAGRPGECTQTSGYLADAEIKRIIQTNPSATTHFDGGSDTDILVYNDTQWVGYSSETTRSTRTNYFQGLNFAGTSIWAVDLTEFVKTPMTIDIGELGYDVTDEKCSNLCVDVIRGTMSDEDIATFIKCGASYIDSLFTSVFTANPSLWVQKMTMETGQSINCDSFPSGSDCDPLDYNKCSQYPSGLYQAMWIAHVFYVNLKAWQVAFNSDAVLAEVNIDQIVTTFPPHVPADTSLSTVLTILGSALGGIGAGTGNVPASVLSALFGLVGTAIQSSSGTPDEASWLDTNLNFTIVATLDGMSRVDTDVFGKGNLASFPPALTSGNYTSAMANFFSHGRVMFPLDTTEQTDLRHQLAQRVKAGMVGQALVGGDYYWVKNAIAPEYCAENRGFMLDGSCNTLQYPNETCEAKMFGHRDPVATQNTLDNIKAYGIDLADLFTSSEKCQLETGKYYGTSSRAFDDLGILTGSKVPPCFYNLPVFDFGGYYPDDFVPSGCDVYKYNVSATQNGTPPVLGKTWLPPRLADYFTNTQCICTVTPGGFAPP